MDNMFLKKVTKFNYYFSSKSGKLMTYQDLIYVGCCKLKNQYILSFFSDFLQSEKRKRVISKETK